MPRKRHSDRFTGIDGSDQIRGGRSFRLDMEVVLEVIF